MRAVRKRYGDSFTMAGRCLLLSVRNPDTFLTSIVLPLIMMLLFVSLFGSFIQVEGISYVDYIVPGVLLQCFGQCSSVTAIFVNRDVSSGMMNRFSVLPIRKSAVLTGHILEAMVRNFLAVGTVLLAALFMGFRPSANGGDWCVLILLLAGAALAFSWLAVAIGGAAGSPEGASGLFTFAIVLPYLSSGFVPAEAMPRSLGIFAQYQPMTPMINAMRNALLGKPLEEKTLLSALLWCVGLTAVFYILSVKVFQKRLSR